MLTDRAATMEIMMRMEKINSKAADSYKQAISTIKKEIKDLRK
jgi:hypothetical protein